MDTAHALISALHRDGADTVFGVPGGGPNLDVIGAASEAGLRFVLGHGETASAITAATYGMLTGRPAMAIATRGPGAASAVNGAAQATLDRYPLLLVTDCVPAADRERVAHQRLDQTALLGPATKWSGTIGGPRAEQIATRALQLAACAPRGAVHLDYDPGHVGEPPDRVEPAGCTPDAASFEHAVDLLRAATAPIAIVGLEAIDDALAVRVALERLGVPVLTTYQAAGLLPEGHPQLAGLYTSGAIERAVLASADLVIAVGLDTVEPMPSPWSSEAPVITISAVAPASSFVPAGVELHGPVGATLTSLAAGADPSHGWSADAGAAALRDARAALAAASTGTFGPLELTRALAAAVPPDATATVDAGAHFLAIMPFWPARAAHQLLISNGLATMGFSVPAAIGTALARPGRPVLCMTGDGGLGMTLAELETIARLRLPITVVVFDDATLSLIAIKQRPGQGGEAAVRYGAIDFAGVARSIGLDACCVESVGELERHLGGGWSTPRLIDARIDPASYPALIATTRG